MEEQVSSQIEALTDEQIVEALSQEGDKWEEMNLSPLSLGTDVFKMRCEMDVLIEYLFEVTDMNADDWNNRVRRLLLFRMVVIRRNIKSQMMKAQILHGVREVMDQKVPGVILPHGAGQ